MKRHQRYRRTIASQYMIVAMIIASIAGFAWLGMFVMSRVPFTDHFAIPWAAARAWLLEGMSPYSSSVVQLASETLGDSPFLAHLPASQVLTQPLLSLVFYLPFSLIPYEISRVMWLTVLGMCVGLIGFVSIRLSGWKLSILETLLALLLMVFWLPGAEAILSGQLSPIIIVLVFVGIQLVLDEQDTAAGLILSLTVSSFPSSGLILIVLLVWSISQKRWSILSGLFSGFIFLLIVSWLILPSWFLDWFSVLYHLIDGWDWIQTPLMALGAFLPGIADFVSIFLHAAIMIYAIYLMITLLGKMGLEFIYKILAILVLAYLLHIQVSLFLLILVVPAMFLIFRFWCERWRLFGRFFSWGLLILVSLGSWLLVFPNIDFTIAFAVPWLTLGYPLFVLLGLTWIRWWTLRIPSLPIDHRDI